MAAGSWETTSSRPAMSRSANRRDLDPLVEFLVLVLRLRVVLERLFDDLKLVGVTGARMVDWAECRARDSVEITNISGRYTGSTGTGELDTPPDGPAGACLDGTGRLSRVLGGAVRRF